MVAAGYFPSSCCCHRCRCRHSHIKTRRFVQLQKVLTHTHGPWISRGFLPVCLQAEKAHFEWFCREYNGDTFEYFHKFNAIITECSGIVADRCLKWLNEFQFWLIRQLQNFFAFQPRIFVNCKVFSQSVDQLTHFQFKTGINHLSLGCGENR